MSVRCGLGPTHGASAPLPNIENLKKRAKTLVKQHRGKYYPVAARLRLALPRFADLTDKAILDEPFALSDAFEAIAHELGFASWALARKELRKMPSPPGKPTEQTQAPRLIVAYPQVLVSDVGRAAGFYVDKLGFSIIYLYGEPPFYGLVTRDGAGLNLRHVDAPDLYQVRDQAAVLAANIPVDGVKALFLEFQRRGVTFAQALKEQPWGTTDFLVRDLDGNLICFASAAGTARRATKERKP